MRLHRFRALIAPEHTIQLNPHQAPLVYATLAAAYGLAAKCNSVLPDGVLVEAPEQGRVRVEPRQPLAFGWSMFSVDHRDARLRCDRLINGLRQLGAKSRQSGKPLAGGFEVLEVRDVIADEPLQRDAEFTGIQISDDIRLRRSSLPASSDQSLTIRFTTPLRIRRPSSARQAGSGHAFVDQHWFCGHRWLRSLDRRLRDVGLDHLCPSRDQPEVDQVFQDAHELCDTGNLTWLDLPYQGQGGSKSLGGIVGSVSLSRVHAAWFPAIFWGQLIGVGRNTAMGLGRYTVSLPDLRLCIDEHLQNDAQNAALTAPLQRSASLLEYALNAGAIDRGAARYGLPVGQALASAQQIREGTYQPQQPNRFVLHDGEKRPRHMVVPTPRDRALQVAVLESIAPAVDRYLETSSFAYRRGLGRHSAAKQVTRLSKQGYCWPVRSDVHRFFDSVDHGVLRARLEAYLPDKPLINLLMDWVQATNQDTQKGLPTGAPVSPVLANLLLDQFDEAIEQSGAKLVRYADDFLILHRTQQEAQAAIEVARVAAAALRLKLNEDKTLLFRPDDSFDFLGFRFEQDLNWRFHDTLPIGSVDGFGWTDLKEAARSGTGNDSLPPLPGESAPRSTTHSSVAVLTPRVARLIGKPDRLIALDRVDHELKTLRCRNLQTILVQGKPTLDTSALKQVIEHEIDLLFVGKSGHLQAELQTPRQSGTSRIQIAQLELIQNPEAGLPAARSLVISKLHNTAATARTIFPGQPGVQISSQILQIAEAALEATSYPELLGFEGAAAAVWYGEFGRRLPQEFQFKKRVAPRATDPANAMLNIAHTHLHRVSKAAAIAAGLLPELGALHRPRSGHDSLASDLQEPFRHLADRIVWVASTKLSKDDFKLEPNVAQPVSIRPRAMRKLFQLLYTTLAMHCENQDGVSGTYRDHLFRQARQYRRWLVEPEEPLVCFKH